MWKGGRRRGECRAGIGGFLGDCEVESGLPRWLRIKSRDIPRATSCQAFGGIAMALGSLKKPYRRDATTDSKYFRRLEIMQLRFDEVKHHALLRCQSLSPHLRDKFVISYQRNSREDTTL